MAAGCKLCRLTTSTKLLIRCVARGKQGLFRLVSRTAHSTRKSSSASQGSLIKHIANRIQVAGPLTVASYMQEVLTNPHSGYYVKQDVFGAAGDFTTSPEISQVFGELVGIWLVHQWIQAGKPTLQLVELGPGRGTLMADILRVVNKFKELQKNLSVHLVEVSPVLSQLQERALGGNKEESPSQTNFVNDSKNAEAQDIYYRNSVTPMGVPVFWYQSIKDIPAGCTFFLAHEFFDVLPVHQFQKTDKGWREVLVDLEPGSESPRLRFVLAPGPTLASETLVPADCESDQLEVSPQAGAVVEHMSDVISVRGGCALIVDYGAEVVNRHTLRAFKQHKLHSVLEDPGNADVTANVDFSFLRRATRGRVQSFGPVTQAEFLQKMGIETRMEVLLSKASSQAAEQLRSSYRMLTSGDEMGEKFKFFCLTHKGAPEPAAFS